MQYILRCARWCCVMVAAGLLLVGCSEPVTMKYKTENLCDMFAEVKSDSTRAKYKYTDRLVELTGEICSVNENGFFLKCCNSCTGKNDILCITEGARSVAAGRKVTVCGRIVEVDTIVKYKLNVEYIK